MARVTFRLDDELDAAIEDRLSYRDSKSEWLREAAKEKLEAEDAEDTGDAEAIVATVK